MSDPDTATTGKTRRVLRLVDELAEARELHALAADPHLNAVRVERLRTGVTRCLWFFLACGLGFTTTGVHAFLAGHLTPADPLWWGAWLVEPAFAGILITVLRWEAEVLARGAQITAHSVGALKWVLLTATLFMNVYPTVRPPQGTPVSLGTVVVHLVIPVVVFLIAQVVPVVQQVCAHLVHSLASGPATPAPPQVDAPSPVPSPVAGPAAPAPAPAPPVEPAPPAPAPQPQEQAPPAPVEPPAPVPAPVPAASSVKLPPQMLAQVTATVNAARQAGRAPTVADVQSVVRMSDSLAARVLADLAPVNGHPVA